MTNALLLSSIHDSYILLTFGGLFFLGLIADLIGRHSFIPRVTLLLLSGFLIGPSGLNLLPEYVIQLFPILTTVALTMVGFLLGQKLTKENIRELGGITLILSICIVFMTVVAVFFSLLFVGVQLEIALILSTIAIATAPAATLDTAHEIRAKGSFTRTLLSIVAIDDIWGLIIFSVVLAFVQSLYSGQGGFDIISTGLWEVFGAFMLGIILGIPLGFLTGRIKSGEATQAEALGIVLLCSGVSLWLEVSYILTAIVMGSVIANSIKDRCSLFHVVEHIEWPSLILFFILAGASLHVDSLKSIGLVSIVYILFRLLGRWIGSHLGGYLSQAEPKVKNWMGLALTPQAGVAIGMALLASQRFPEFASTILTLVLGTTIVFEITGPVLTRWILIHIGEAKNGKKTKDASD